jgi:hypothetical protein
MRTSLTAEHRSNVTSIAPGQRGYGFLRHPPVKHSKAGSRCLQAVRLIAWTTLAVLVILSNASADPRATTSMALPSEDAERIEAARLAVLALGKDPRCFDYRIVFGSPATGFRPEPGEGLNRAVALAPTYCEAEYPMWHVWILDKVVVWDLSDGPRTRLQDEVIGKAYAWYSTSYGAQALDPEEIRLYVREEGMQYYIEFIPKRHIWRPGTIAHFPAVLIGKQDQRVIAPILEKPD